MKNKIKNLFHRFNNKTKRINIVSFLKHFFHTPASIIFQAFIFCILFWMIDGVLDRFYFYEGYGSFFEQLIYGPVTHEIYMRLIVVTCIMGFGCIIAVQYSLLRRSKDNNLYLNQILRTSREINRFIVRETRSENLIHGICDLLVKNRIYNNACIVLLDNKKEYFSSAFAGEKAKNIDFEENIKENEWSSCILEALKKNNLITKKGAESECSNCPFAPLLTNNMCYVVSLKHKNNTYGILYLNIPVRSNSSKEELNLMKESADDIGFALYNIDLENEQQETLRKLRKNQDLLNKTQSLAKIGSWEYDLIKDEMKCSEEAYRIFGYEPNEYEPNELEPSYEKTLSFIIPEDRERIKNYYEKSLSKGKEECEEEYKIITKNNEEKVIFDKCENIKDSEGNVVRSIGMIQDITKQKYLERSLLRAKEWAEKYLEIVDVIIIGMDKMGNVFLINRKGCDILGYPEEDIIGSNFFENFLPENIRGELGQLFNKLISKNSDSEEYYENPIINSKGELRTIEWHNSVLEDEGEVWGILSAGNDITERKIEERKINEYQELLRSTFEAIDSTLLLINKNYRVILSNTNNLQGEILLSEDKDSPPCCFEIFMDPGNCDNCLAYKTFKDGEKREYENKSGNKCEQISVIPIYDSDGNVEYVLENIRDVTEQKRLEEKLKINEEKFRKIFENANDAIYLHRFHDDGPGEFIEVNSTACNLLGYTKEEFKTMRVEDIHTSEEFQDKLPILLQESEKKDHARFETYHLSRNGNKIPVEVNAHSVQLNNERYHVSIVRDITERKKTEKQLREKESFLKEIIDSLTPHIAVLDETANIVLVNRAWQHFAETHNGSPEKVSEGTNYLDVCYRATGDYSEGAYQFADNIKQIISNKKDFYNVAYPCPTESEGVRWFEAKITPIKYFSTNYILVSHEDVTDYKEFEQSIRKNEEKYRHLFETSRDAIWILDPYNSEVIDANHASIRMFRCKDKKEFESYTPWHLSPEYQPDGEKSIDKAKRMINIALEKGENFFEWWHQRMDGENFPTSIMLTRFEIEDEYYVHTVLREITERKKAEKAIRDSEERYRNLFQNAQVGLFRSRIEDGKILESNKQFAEILGYNNREKLLKYEVKTDKILPPEKRKSILEVLNNYGEIQNSETQIYTKDGDTIWVMFSARIYPSKGFIEGVIEDITQRKEMEEKLRELSIYDSLTKLYSRSFFEEQMKYLEDNRYRPIGVLVCDIDGLKIINDTMGHAKGDEFLKLTADILKRCFRDKDIIARIGGDEFVVLMPQTSSEFVEKVSENIRSEAIKERSKGLSLSIGYTIKNDSPVDIIELFKEADSAMYKEKLHHSYSTKSETIKALVKTLETRDYVMEGHTNRVEEYSELLGRYIGLSEDRINDLKLLAQFHDIGKVGISDAILFKPGSLNEEEFEEMKRHSEIGYRIALSSTDLISIAEYILKHHERWDGGGYPLGCKGEQIPIESRILALADSYDTITSERPYKNAMTQQDAIKEIKRCAGTQFDPDLVKKFIKVLEDKKTENS